MILSLGQISDPPLTNSIQILRSQYWFKRQNWIWITGIHLTGLKHTEAIKSSSVISWPYFSVIKYQRNDCKQYFFCFFAHVQIIVQLYNQEPEVQT